ncbi:MAG: hypothetical protein PHY54_17840 [Methylococcales bacterium]|nr:hypothetical protein [Methylococcales bacterium]
MQTVQRSLAFTASLAHAVCFVVYNALLSIPAASPNFGAGDKPSLQTDWPVLSINSPVTGQSIRPQLAAGCQSMAVAE